MKNRVSSLAAAVLFSAGTMLSANYALALPAAGGDAVKSATVSNVEHVRWHRGWGWGVGAGLLGGAIIGSALAAPYYGYGPGYYYGPGPYYYGPPAPAYYAPPPGDAVAYCSRRYRSYDPRTGTFLGNDGYRHPCP